MIDCRIPRCAKIISILGTSACFVSLLLTQERFRTSWAIGLSLFFLCLHFLWVFPSLTIVTTNMYKQPLYYETIEKDGIARKIFHKLLGFQMAVFLFVCFYYWCSRFEGWNGHLPEFSAWSISEFFTNLASLCVLIFTVNINSGTFVLKLSQYLGRRKRNALVVRAMGLHTPHPVEIPPTVAWWSAPNMGAIKEYSDHVAIEVK